jgi:hypothetical protein
MAARRYLQSLKDPGEKIAATTPLSNRSENKTVTFRDYDSGIVSGQQVLDKRLKIVQETIEDFFDDRDLQVVAASAANVDSQNTLASLSGALRRIPLFPKSQEFPEKARPAPKAAKKKSLLSVFKVVQGRARDKRILYYDVILTALSSFGVLLMFVANNVAWTSPGGGSTVIKVVDQLSPITVAALRIVYYIIFATTLGFFAVLVQYYRLLLGLKRHEWSEVNGQQIISRNIAFNFWKSTLPRKMLAEFAVHCVFPYPWYNQLDSSNAKYLELFMFARLYTVIRVLHHSSSLFRFRNDILNNTLSLKRANFTVGVLDTMKVYLFTHTVTSTALLYILISVVGGFCVFVAERNYEGTRFLNTLDGVYFMIVTIRAIGYGDIVPQTFVGRSVTVIFQFLGAATETVAASIVVNKIAKSKEEKIVDEYLLSFGAWHKFRVASAMVIQAFWKTSKKYQYLHKKISQEQMVQLMKAQKRRKDFLQQLSVAKGRVKVKDADASGTLALRLEDDSVMQSKELRGIVHHFASQEVRKSSYSRCSHFGVYNMNSNPDDESSLKTRMPYMREKDLQVDSALLIERSRKMFSLDSDISRWGRNFNSTEPRSFKKVRTFSSTKKVVGHHGERRIPIGEGHKADLRLEALAIFRQARLEFKQSIATSADHVVDGKLYIAYELLVAASAKLKRNVILLLALRRAVQQELQSTAEQVDLSMSGGVPPDELPTKAGTNP